MSAKPPMPVCPQCARPIAAWKKAHCVYCGAEFPPDLKAGFKEPETLKWVERPGISPEAARKLELMKVTSLEGAGRARSLPMLIGLLSLPIFAVLFYLLASLLRRYSPAAATVVLAAGVGFLGYLAWSLHRALRR